jgi:hypothetical protein
MTPNRNGCRPGDTIGRGLDRKPGADRSFAAFTSRGLQFEGSTDCEVKTCLEVGPCQERAGATIPRLASRMQPIGGGAHRNSTAFPPIVVDLTVLRKPTVVS